MERELSKEEVEALRVERRKQLRNELYGRVAELNTFMKTNCSIEEMRIAMRKRQDIAAKLQSLFTSDDMAKLVEEWGEPEEDSDEFCWT